MRRFYAIFLRPFSAQEDKARQEFILNVLLLGSIVLSLAATILVINSYLSLRPNYQGVSPTAIAGVLLFFSCLYLLSRRRYYRASGLIFVLFYFLIGALNLYSWGIMLAQGWMVLVLVIIMSSVLISTFFAGAVSLLIVSLAFLLTYLQTTGQIHPKLFWVTQPGHYNDAIAYSFSIGVIAVVSWLSNREIAKSLKRARSSEGLLKKERDQLETIVEQRTRALIKAQREELLQLHRFAEFGHLATDLLHDLMVPLTSVSLDVKRFNQAKQTRLSSRAVKGVEKMERFISSARKQIQHQEQRSLFRLADEVLLAREVLGSRARKGKVKMVFSLSEELKMFGSAIAFHKVAVNLLSNAIDACAEKNGLRQVTTTLELVGQVVRLTVKDTGVGITPAKLKKVFDPFFTTKDAASGIGIGLSVVQEMVEKELGGTVVITSQAGRGTTVIVEFPLVADGKKARQTR